LQKRNGLTRVVLSKTGIYDESFADENLEVRTEDAHNMVKRLAWEEGLFVGISSGATAVAALRVASELEQGVVVTLFPDAGYKYLSNKSLWESPLPMGEG
jgi:cysteine synthase B